MPNRTGVALYSPALRSEQQQMTDKHQFPWVVHNEARRGSCGIFLQNYVYVKNSKVGI